jgi:pimeloyl-ACP methyl ester carboxylesterase
MPSRDVPQAIPAGMEERWATLPHGEVRYLGGGSGPPLVLVHGLMGYSFSWRFNLPAFAARAAVFAPDLPGCGFSRNAADLDASLAGTAATLRAFLGVVGISCCDIVATSHGGPVALVMAAAARQRGEALVRQMVLCAPANPWSSTRRLLIAALQTTWGAALFRRLAPRLRFSLPYWLGRLYGDPRRMAPGTIAGYAGPLGCAAGFDRALSVIRTWDRDLQALPAALAGAADIPTLLIWGTRDRAVLPASADALRRAIPQAELIWIHGAGHLPYEECPEEFNRAVSKFLWPAAAS